MRIAWIVPLVAGLGCRGPEWRTDLQAAKNEHRPLLVLSILGDLKQRC